MVQAIFYGKSNNKLIITRCFIRKTTRSRSHFSAEQGVMSINMSYTLKCPVCDQKPLSAFKKLYSKKIECASCKTELHLKKAWYFSAFFFPIMISAQLHFISWSARLWVLPLLVLLAFSIIIFSPLTVNEKNS